MGSITLDELLAMKPKRVQDAVSRESAKLTAECLLMHDEDKAQEFIKHLPRGRQEEIMREVARLKAKKKSKTVASTNTSDSPASVPTPLSAPLSAPLSVKGK